MNKGWGQISTAALFACAKSCCRQIEVFTCSTCSTAIAADADTVVAAVRWRGEGRGLCYDMARRPPNILITGTPGTGKTSTCQLIAEATGLRHVNVGDRVKLEELHSGWDQEFDSFIIDEDKVRIGTGAAEVRGQPQHCY